MSPDDVAATWVEVAPVDRLPIDRGVAALVDGRPIAVFRLASGDVYALDHVEPFTNMPVLARGLVGSVGDVPTVASPLHKQRFDLRDGTCVDDPDVYVDTFAVSIVDAMVSVSPSPRRHHRPTPPSTTTPATTGAPSMTPQQITLVQQSFAAVEPISDQAAALFYGRLFEIAPDVRPLFGDDMEGQGRKLMATLGAVVRGLDDLDSILPVAGALAARHVRYGVVPEHYPIVGQALLWTLEQGLADAFTDDVSEAWSTAYGALSAAMIESAYGTDPVDERVA